jgi:hypothetical protein
LRDIGSHTIMAFDAGFPRRQVYARGQRIGASAHRLAGEDAAHPDGLRRWKCRDFGRVEVATEERRNERG